MSTAKILTQPKKLHKPHLARLCYFLCLARGLFSQQLTGSVVYWLISLLTQQFTDSVVYRISIILDSYITGTAFNWFNSGLAGWFMAWQVTGSVVYSHHIILVQDLTGSIVYCLKGTLPQPKKLLKMALLGQNQVK